MLSVYVDLQPNDWVIQNASNSGVGRAVIAFADARGLRISRLALDGEAARQLRGQVRPEYDTKIPGILQEATAMIAPASFIPAATTYPLSAIKDAVAHVERGGGKVLLDAQKA